MLLTIAGVLIVIWLIALLVHVGGALIHILLVIGLIVLIMHFLQRGKTKV